jgi:hypothetical protein
MLALGVFWIAQDAPWGGTKVVATLYTIVYV